MLKINNLCKKYKGAKAFTLQGLNLEVNKGEIFGIVGQNGIGKSTLIKCFTGIIPFDSGEILINGFNLKTQEKQAKSSMGYVPDDHSLYEMLTGREYINFIANMYDVQTENRDKLIELIAEKFLLTDALDRQISGYSHGMKQKTCLIGAIIHNPKLWILDEPILGLDPQSAEELCQMMRNHVSRGENSVVFSSHNYDTVAKMCDRVGIVADGRIVKIIDMHNVEDSSNFRKIVESYRIKK